MSTQGSVSEKVLEIKVELLHRIIGYMAELLPHEPQLSREVGWRSKIDFLFGFARETHDASDFEILVDVENRLEEFNQQILRNCED